MDVVAHDAAQHHHAGAVFDFHDLVQLGFQRDPRRAYPGRLHIHRGRDRQPGLLKFADAVRIFSGGGVHGFRQRFIHNVDHKFAGRLDVDQRVFDAAAKAGLIALGRKRKKDSKAAA